MQQMDKAIYRQLEAELARAEAVVLSDTKIRKQHAPTIDNHRGQIIALRKALALLEMEETRPPGPIEVKRTINITISWRALFLILAVLVTICVF